MKRHTSDRREYVRATEARRGGDARGALAQLVKVPPLPAAWRYGRLRSSFVRYP